MKKSHILIFATLALSACDSGSNSVQSEPSIEDMEFTYISSQNNGIDDCPEEGCGEGPQISMCTFASNLGTLAILENFGELEVYEEERACRTDVVRYSMNVRVVQHIAGEKLPDEINLHALTFGRPFNVEGSIALVQLHEFEGRYRLISMIPIEKEGFLDNEEAKTLRDEEVQILPNTLRSLKEEANRIAESPEDCTDTDFPPRTEQFWNDTYYGVCTD